MHATSASLRPWLLMAGLGIAAIAVGGIYFFWAPKTQAAPQQPIAFNHETMVQAGVPCLYCHADATKSPSAGMPSVEQCMGCHKVINPDSPEIKKLAGFWVRQEAIPWVRVNQLPRFVYFSHQAHVVAAGLNCESCHGDVGHMSATRPVVQMTMSWCLDCHKQQPNAPQLVDCVTCHQ